MLKFHGSPNYSCLVEVKTMPEIKNFERWTQKTNNVNMIKALL